LDDTRFDQDREAILERAQAAGVSTILTIATGATLEEQSRALQLAEQYPFVYAAVGIHPHDAARASVDWPRWLRDLLQHPKVVAVGEIGLDYHYNFSPPEIQRTVFAQQLAIAVELGKPVIVHTREAWPDTLALLKRELGERPRNGILHCFSGGPDELAAGLGMGFYISFAGVVTFPKAQRTQECAQRVPLDRLLIETDAPYLAPVPHRGKRNEPAFVIEVARKIAELRQMPVDELAAVTTANFYRLCLPGSAGAQ